MKVSIIIPVYNVEKYISRCLNSVINQTMTEGVECIIIDDCTPDNSMDIIEQILKDYNGGIQFQIIHNKNNRGIAAVRNMGLLQAKGDYISYIDSDDYCEPNMIEEMYMLAIQKNADMVISDYYVHTSHQVSYIHQFVPNTWEECFRANLSDRLKGFLWNKLIKREL